MKKESLPNHNVSSNEIQSTKFVSTKQETDHEFSEELSDGGERNEIITIQQNK
jgi:hypothetical protein